MDGRKEKLVEIDTGFYAACCDRFRIKQTEVAAATGYSPTYCAEVKRGERTRVAVKFLRELVTYMRIRTGESDMTWYQALLAD